jgi:hypothetical protein
MKTQWIGMLLLVPLASTALADESIKIDRIKRDKEYLYVDDQWLKNNPCITVTFRVSADMPSANLTAKAYFFDADKKLLKTLTEYTSWSTGKGDLVRLPQDLKGGEANEIYFGMPMKMENDWHRVVVVLAINGKPDSILTEIYPDDNLSDYPVPAK